VLIPYMAGIYGVFLVRQFMLSIPRSPAAARIDGASRAHYWSVILPVARPVLATLAISPYVRVNDFMAADHPHRRRSTRSRSPSRTSAASTRPRLMMAPQRL
jgi:ABC-type maltose transport system permease subunit